MAPEAAVDAVARVVVLAVPLLVAIVLHEVAHGAVARACGDPTAAEAGRLTLNPIRHLDPVGSLLVPGLLLVAPLLFGGGSPTVFGWARPVPIDPRRMRHPRRDSVLVALAGPGTNLVLAALSTAALVALRPEGFLADLLVGSLVVNCVLAVFNLLPVPPLDGSRVVEACLPASGAMLFARLQGVGFLVLVFVLMNTNLIARLTRPLLLAFGSFLPR